MHRTPSSKQHAAKPARVPHAPSHARLALLRRQPPAAVLVPRHHALVRHDVRPQHLAHDLVEVPVQRLRDQHQHVNVHALVPLLQRQVRAVEVLRPRLWPRHDAIHVAAQHVRHARLGALGLVRQHELVERQRQLAQRSAQPVALGEQRVHLGDPAGRLRERVVGPRLVGHVEGHIAADGDDPESFEYKFGFTFEEFHAKWTDFLDLQPGNLFGWDPGLPMNEHQTLVLDASPRSFRRTDPTAPGTPIVPALPPVLSANPDVWFDDPEQSVELLKFVQNPLATNEGGIAALWRGVAATAVRATLLSGAQLATYDELKSRLKSAGVATEGPRLHVFCGAISGLVAQTVCQPADTIKSRVLSGGFPSAGACLKHTLTTEGVAGLFRGYLPAICRQTPVVLVQMPLIEEIRRLAGLGHI